jgi:hypothetical protein
LSETQIEVEFNEIQLLENPGERPQLVYTNSKEYTYKWTTQQWNITIQNPEATLINPRIFTIPISAPNTLGRDAEYQEQLNMLLEQTDDFFVSAKYWNSVPKQNPDQAVPFPPSSSPHHLRLCLQFASVESTFAGVITNPTRLPLPLTLNCGNPLRNCNPEEEYITCITAALQNLAPRSRMVSRDN